MRRLPEPEGDNSVGGSLKFSGILRQTWRSPALRQFMAILLLVALVSAVARAFLVVYAREIFNQTDGMVSLYTVFGGLGVLMIGLLVKFLVDRVGAKPIFIICVIIGLVSMAPMIIFPAGVSETTAVLYLTFLFFVMNFGFLGAEGIAQIYFLGIIPPEQMLDMGILYYFSFGIAGAGGSLLAGVFLDALAAAGFSQFTAFRFLYLALIITGAVVLILQRKMTPLGAMPFKGALEVIFSFRDLRAISLLEKLNKTSDSAEEAALLEALHDTPSRLSSGSLLTRARSPRLQVRLDALRAIDALESLDAKTERALMDDIVANPYTTAYNSARILGSHGVFAAIPLLRELSASDDYMLAGEAIIALAKLGDHAFRPQIEELIARTDNPRLKIMGVEAFGIYGSPTSLPALVDLLRGADPPPYLRDEVILAMAAILKVQNQFYPLLVRFLEDESLAPTLALDEAESAAEYAAARARHGGGGKIPAAGFSDAVAAYIKEGRGAALARWILELPREAVHPIAQTVLSEVVLDDELAPLPRLRLLVVHWASRLLRGFFPGVSPR